MKGFTLVEMLAALFVFGLLTTAGALVLGSTLEGQEAVRERMDRLGRLQQTRAILKADLGQLAVRPTRTRETGARRPVFTGTAPAGGRPFMAFARRGWGNPDAAPRASLQYVEYRLVDGRLERASHPWLDGSVSGPGQVLVEGVTAARVEYLYRDIWSPAWVAAPDAAYPRAVRLVLEIDGLGAFDQLLVTPGGPR